MADPTGAADAVPNPAVVGGSPTISAVLLNEHTAELTINGHTTTITRNDVTATRRAVIAYITEHYAFPLKQPLRATCRDLDAGTFDIIVSPEGTATTAEASHRSLPAPAAIDQASTRARHRPAEPHQTLQDLLDNAGAQQDPARRGWQAAIRRSTLGLVSPAPGPAELRHRDAIARVQRSFVGPKTVVVVNPKGGAFKTSATWLIAAGFGIHRGGYTVAWDNNETRGTLGWRSATALHDNTAADLLAHIDRISENPLIRVGDIDHYVRSQGSAHFDVLASPERADSAASIDADAFGRLHQLLSRLYRIIVIDTGNNHRAPNWQAALAHADQLVLISTIRYDTAASAAWLAEALRGDPRIRHAVTVLAAPSPTSDVRLRARLHRFFEPLTRVVLDVPYDPSLVDGKRIRYAALSPASREAWLRVTAAIADGLQSPPGSRST